MVCRSCDSWFLFSADRVLLCRAGQVQTNIHALVILYVDRHLFRQMQRIAIRGFDSLEISRDHIVGLAGGNALSEFTRVIGRKLPLRPLLGNAADFDRYAIDGVIVRSPNRSENK